MEGELPFSHVVKADKLIFLTSQLSCDLKTGKIIRGSIEEQTEKAIENMKYLLEEANSSLKNVVKVIVYLKKAKYFSKMNKVYKKYFKSNYPTRITVEAKSPIKGIDIEIEVTALENEY